ncbi:hypothetical protein LUZ60_010541 [Juncus effusus]|nr:hypothetical protein LUZ60_010541 [Juncus effusus]
MAFHVSCPVTCQRICYCNLGFPPKPSFLDDISKLQSFLQDPWILKPFTDSTPSTIQIPVPHLNPPEQAVGTPGSPVEGIEGIGLGIEGIGGIEGIEGGENVGRGKEESAWAQSVRAKRAELQRQAAEASLAAEDYVRRLEAGALAMATAGETANNVITEDQNSAAAVKIICRICYSGETEGSTSASKMLPCKTCNKKYHRSCVKVWAEYRDLFHWNSWSCPSCRTCEVCTKTGDPTKFKFCKRCDGAYHCYCQQPPHKNVSHGPFLCPKHTRCHSCGSTVPGSGISTRWFLSYTNCDACGRLFVKGKYCPVCLKVYRDSEMTPMVCCDGCQQWVHCVCDGISDEKYRQFESDSNLHYKCPPCRGESYKVKDMEDAVRELWRRRDTSERRLIASLRAASGLPIETSSYPYSDEEEKTRMPLVRPEPVKSLKFSVKSKPKEEPAKTPALKKVAGKSGQTGQPVKLSFKGGHKGASGESESGGNGNNTNNKGTKLVIHLGSKNKAPAQHAHLESTPAADNKSIKASEKPATKSKIKFTNLEARGKEPVLASNDPKPLLKLKFKNPYFEQKSGSKGEKEIEKNQIVKGQRSKRKRTSKYESGNSSGNNGNNGGNSGNGNSGEVADAEWILRKLGKDAVGKRVEFQIREDSWQKGMVSDVKDGTSSVSVRLDNGTSKTVELGKQKIRFISQKRSRKST